MHLLPPRSYPDALRGTRLRVIKGKWYQVDGSGKVIRELTPEEANPALKNVADKYKKGN